MVNRYDKICKALGTDTLKKPEFLKFVSVRENRKPVPYILSAPLKNRYDPIRNTWSKDDLLEHFDTEKIFAIPDCISGYKRFDLSDTIRQKSATAAEEQDDCEPQEVPGVISFKFSWTTYHDAVCSLVLGSLVSKP